MIELKHIELNIGKACNNRCLFCMSKNSQKYMLKLAEYSYVVERLDYYFNLGYNSVGFLGGDISIHPKILDILSKAKEIGFIRINIITNGMLFENYNFAKNIVLRGATRINFSLHSHIHDIENYLTQVPGGLNKKNKAIDNFNLLFQQGLLISALSINIVVNKINYLSVFDTIIFYYKNKNIKDYRLNFIWLSKQVKENWDILTLSYTDFIPEIKKIIYFSLQYKVRVTFDTIPPCIFYKIDPKNYEKLIKIFLGEQFDYINEIEHVNVKIKRENFNWKEKKKNNLKQKVGACKKCKYKYTCEGIWKEYINKYSDNEFITLK